MLAWCVAENIRMSAGVRGEGGMGREGAVRMRALMVGNEEAMVSSFVGVLDE